MNGKKAFLSLQALATGQILDDFYVIQKKIETADIQESAANIGLELNFRRKTLDNYDPNYIYIPDYAVRNYLNVISKLANDPLCSPRTTLGVNPWGGGDSFLH